MPDFVDPFLTFYGHSPDHNQADGRKETEALATRQGLIEDWLEGFESAESVLDCLEEQGVGATDFVKLVQANVQSVIDEGTAYVQNESGLLIPEMAAWRGS